MNKKYKTKTNLKLAKMFIIIFLLLINFSLLINPVLSNTTISYNQKFLSYLSPYGKYFLWDLENKKLIKTKDISFSIKRIFYIDNDNLALLSDNSISIANSTILRPEKQFNINYEPLFLYSLNAFENYYKFLLLTDKTINICEIKNDKLIYLKKDTILKPSNLVYISKNSFLISANRFVYLYNISNFLWFNFINKKKMLNFDRIANYIDVDNKKNKFLVLTRDGKLNLYTIGFQNLKEIQLNPEDKIALYALNNSDIIITDKSTNIRIYTISGNLKNTLNFPNQIIDIIKTDNYLVIIYGDSENPTLRLIDKEYNTITEI
jgi:WD40 repeat protein